MLIIKNQNVTCEISEVGAQIRSLTINNENVLWRGLAEYWAGVAPILFPICGGLRDNKFIYDGKEYTLEKHGYVRFQNFTVESKIDDEITLLHKSNGETLKSYPFNYEFRANYKLTDNGVKISFAVKNTDNKAIYFSLGSHEGYATPEGIEDYDLIFPEKETLNSYLVDGNVLQKNTVPIMKNSYVLPLYDKYFAIDSLVFKNIKSRSVKLRNRKTGRYVNIDFPNMPYLVLWHKHMSPFFCVEPWQGIVDPQDSDYDITKKEGIICLPQGETHIATHTITIGNED